MRTVIARCAVDYSGRLDAHLPEAVRLVMIKADGSVLIHSDGGSYKPLNWMNPPCAVSQAPAATAADLAAGVSQVWTVRHTKTEDRLVIKVFEILHDAQHEFGRDPGLVKDGVEAHLQELLAQQIELLGPGHSLVRREYPTAIGPVDILARAADGGTVAVEIKRRGEIDGVEQLTRYLDLLGRDPRLAPVTGVLAAQQIKPQARVLAADRGIRCLLLDYNEMRGVDDSASRLF
jgi:RecB family endonuclease NucS